MQLHGSYLTPDFFRADSFADSFDTIFLSLEMWTKVYSLVKSNVFDKSGKVTSQLPA